MDCLDGVFFVCCLLKRRYGVCWNRGGLEGCGWVGGWSVAVGCLSARWGHEMFIHGRCDEISIFSPLPE